MSLAFRASAKISPRYFGPFPIIARVGNVAYKLQLPPEAKIHPVFHISVLRKHEGPLPSVCSVPDIDEQQQLRAEPFALLDRKLVKKGNQAVVYVLIQWSNGDVTDATWEPYDDIAKRFPQFNLDAA
ncbi:uncharacterized protein LOC141654744 [Silene latifolia]|uniref:uncharacterized protein LOC141654744 n=1 Tax=Silene latifolia TaxID=37657 RepID=UPI003D76C6A2